MADQLPLEKNLNDMSKNLPALPAGGKKALVEWAPWLALIGGLASLWTAWALWQWAHTANELLNFANNLSTAYGGTTVDASRMTFGIWLGVAVLALEGIIYLLAFPGLRDRKKAGWNMLYWGVLLNLAYGLVVMFTDYGTVGSFIGSLIGSAIGMYFLFQIRSAYTAERASAKS
jgi:hypothetical protein